jgi:hypothetical protein
MSSTTFLAALVTVRISSFRWSLLLTTIPDMAEADEIFPNSDRPDAKVKEVRQWLKGKGVLDLEAVSLFCDQLDQVNSRCIHIHLLEHLILNISLGYCSRNRQAGRRA